MVADGIVGRSDGSNEQLQSRGTGPEIVTKTALSSVKDYEAPREAKEQHDVRQALPSGGQERLQQRQDDLPREVSFWNVNVAASEQKEECPEFLRYAFENEKDRLILSTPDSQYRRQSWDVVQRLIEGNRLDLFTRVPSELRLYREYCAKLVEEYSSIMKFVMEERLRWSELVSSSAPFSNPGDYEILFNDWPYGVDERIVHLVVWTKFELPADAASEIGDMRAETRKMVDDFVNRTFVKECGAERVIWFKNWSSLKSVHAVEHFHVMILDPDMDFIRDITNGDVPLFQKVKQAKEGATH